MKKNYQKPTIEVVTIQQQGFMCYSSVDSSVGHNEPAGSRGYDDDSVY